jgi:hypothetical protein
MGQSVVFPTSSGARSTNDTPPAEVNVPWRPGAMVRRTALARYPIFNLTQYQMVSNA